MKKAVSLVAFLTLAFGGVSAEKLSATGVPPPIAMQNCDVNGDQFLDVSDVIAFLHYLFLGGPAPAQLSCGLLSVPVSNGDSNGDGELDVSDTIHLVQYLFMGGPAPASCE